MSLHTSLNYNVVFCILTVSVQSHIFDHSLYKIYLSPPMLPATQSDDASIGYSSYVIPNWLDRIKEALELGFEILLAHDRENCNEPRRRIRAFAVYPLLELILT